MSTYFNDICRYFFYYNQYTVFLVQHILFSDYFTYLLYPYFNLLRK